MDFVVLLAIQVLYAVASLALISVGLAIIFGMMRVINLAHGEFLMLGGYAAIVATSHGVSIWIAMLVVAPVVVGLIGIVVEMTIIRFLYGRMVDTMLATWASACSSGRRPRSSAIPRSAFRHCSAVSRSAICTSGLTRRR